MGKLKNNQSGFGAVEVLLGLIFVAIVAFIGVYVAHNRNNTAKTSSSITSITTSTKKATPAITPTLAEAVTQAQKVYAAYDKQVTAGQVLQDKSHWATSNVLAAEDLQFINANKSYFTDSYVTTANEYQTTNTVPKGGEFLVCESGFAEYNSDLKVAVGKLSGQTATVTAGYTVGHTPSTPYNLPVTLKASGGSWLIDSIDLNSCGS